MNNQEQLQKTQIEQGKTLVRHGQILQQLAKSEVILTEMVKEMQEQNISVKLLTQEVQALKQHYERTEEKVEELQRWHDAVQGAKQTVTWFTRHGPTISKALAFIILAIFVVEKFLKVTP